MLFEVLECSDGGEDPAGGGVGTEVTLLHESEHPLQRRYHRWERHLYAHNLLLLHRRTLDHGAIRIAPRSFPLLRRNLRSAPRHHHELLTRYVPQVRGRARRVRNELISRGPGCSCFDVEVQRRGAVRRNAGGLRRSVHPQRG